MNTQLKYALVGAVIGGLIAFSHLPPDTQITAGVAADFVGQMLGAALFTWAVAWFATRRKDGSDKNIP